MSDDHNARLVERLDDAFDAIESTPTELLAAARDAYAWRNVDARLAELVFDSAYDELVGVRGTATARRSFRFAVDDAVIRVHLADTSLLVMVEPPVSVVCRVVSPASDTVEHRTDDLGELAVDLPELPVRVELDLPGGAAVTPWITG